MRDRRRPLQLVTDVHGPRACSYPAAMPEGSQITRLTPAPNDRRPPPPSPADQLDQPVHRGPRTDVVGHADQRDDLGREPHDRRGPVVPRPTVAQALANRSCGCAGRPGRPRPRRRRSRCRSRSPRAGPGPRPRPRAADRRPSQRVAVLDHALGVAGSVDQDVAEEVAPILRLHRLHGEGLGDREGEDGRRPFEHGEVAVRDGAVVADEHRAVRGRPCRRARGHRQEHVTRLVVARGEPLGPEAP